MAPVVNIQEIQPTKKSCWVILGLPEQWKESLKDKIKVKEEKKWKWVIPEAVVEFNTGNVDSSSFS